MMVFVNLLHTAEYQITADSNGSIGFLRLVSNVFNNILIEQNESLINSQSNQTPPKYAQENVSCHRYQKAIQLYMTNFVI